MLKPARTNAGTNPRAQTREIFIQRIPLSHEVRGVRPTGSGAPFQYRPNRGPGPVSAGNDPSCSLRARAEGDLNQAQQSRVILLAFTPKVTLRSRAGFLF